MSNKINSKKSIGTAVKGEKTGKGGNSKTGGKCCGGVCGTRKKLVAPAPVKQSLWQRILAFLKAS
jgi:hypothetical protein